MWLLQVALDVPIGASLTGIYDYSAPASIELLDELAAHAWVGRAVLVPFGRHKADAPPKCVVGWVVAVQHHASPPAFAIKSIVAPIAAIPPAQPAWLDGLRFVARYFQRNVGEVLSAALPKALRSAATYQVIDGIAELKTSQQAWKRWLKCHSQHAMAPVQYAAGLELNEQQASVLAQIQANTDASKARLRPQLLYGVTGSGKTEVYQHLMAAWLQARENGQILVMLPEINLTPQIHARLAARFGADAVVCLHSRLNEGERTLAWWRIAHGHARVILGTRLSILAPIPHLAAIVVDEEHDPSYKQQDGVRYSARDVAIYRAHQLNIPIVLGSATPSLESWHNARSGRYDLHRLAERAVSGAQLPQVQLINAAYHMAHVQLSEALKHAVDDALAAGQMSLIFYNRRGYAPLVYCTHCAWRCECDACSAYMVYHRTTAKAHCHHCGAQRAIPKHCPQCANPDLKPVGQGTQQLEDTIAAQWPNARVLRIDADTTARQGGLEAQLAQIAAGEVDIIVGTQMLAKGHDWPNLTVVGVLDADSGLFAQDYRAPERLFAQLQQIMGRAGRGADAGRVLIQTQFVEHPIWAHLLAHQYEAFAHDELSVRQSLHLPPYGAHALLVVGANQLNDAMKFARRARQLATDILHAHPQFASITLNAAVPMHMVRVKHTERVQILIESPQRGTLQHFLPLWQAAIAAQKTALTWYIEVDPAEI